MCIGSMARNLAGIGATFNAIRLAVDIVSEATASVRVENEKQNTSNRSQRNNGSEMKSQRHLMERGSRSFLLNKLSAIFSHHSHQIPSTSFNCTNTENYKNTGSRSVTENRSNFDTEEAKNDIQSLPRCTSRLEHYMPCISMAIHIVLLAHFLAVSILSSNPLKKKAPKSYSDSVYGSMASILVSVALLLGIIVNARDYRRQRFNFVQAVFYVLCSVTILIGCILNLAAPSNSPTLVDYFTLLNLIIHTVSVGIECKVFQYHKYQRNNEEKKSRLTKRAILVMLKPYFWPDATSKSAVSNRIRTLLTWVCVIAAKVCNLFAPMLIGKASSSLIEENYPECVKYAILYSVIQFLGSFCKESQGLLYLKVAQEAFVILSEKAFGHLHRLGLDWHLRKKMGEVIRSMDRGISACDTLMKHLFLWLIPAFVECILVCVIFATYFNSFVLAVSTFYFVFAYVVLTIVLALRRKKIRKKRNKSDNDWHEKCTESLVNFENVKYFTAEDFEKRRFGDAVRKYQSESVNFQVALSMLHVGQQFLFRACLATSLILTTKAIKDGDMEFGDFVAVMSYTNGLFQPLNYLGRVYNQIVTAGIDLQNLSELLSETPDVTDASDAIPLPLVNEDEPDIAVEFDNVLFHYPSQPVTKGLRGLSFKMKRGSTTAIVGSTGAGKTTVGRLFFRFYDVLGGSVKINGIDVKKVTQSSLRSAIGVVPQTTTMFNDTIKSNIMYGRRDASDEDIEKTCKEAQLWNFITSLPDGWDSMVGDRGLKLSGGEKQRCAIARCLLKDPPFVLLDEATSALDTKTEKFIQEALDTLGSDRTCLIIAHRLGTIRHADNIIVLNDGVVVEQGTHDKLLALNGIYNEMWNLQLHSIGDGSVDLNYPG